MQSIAHDVSAPQRTELALLLLQRGCLDSVCQRVHRAAQGVDASVEDHRHGLDCPKAAVGFVPEPDAVDCRYRFFMPGRGRRECLCVVYDSCDRLVACGYGRGRIEARLAACEDLRTSRVRHVSLAVLSSMPRAVPDDADAAGQDDFVDRDRSPGPVIAVVTPVPTKSDSRKKKTARPDRHSRPVDDASALQAPSP